MNGVVNAKNIRTAPLFDPYQKYMFRIFISVNFDRVVGSLDPYYMTATKILENESEISR